MTKIKLIDVANKAGVSKSTASQFLNKRYDYMSKATRAKIQKAVDELNYIPNSIARSLKTDKTKTIGVVVRDVAGSYTSQAIRGMDDYCKTQGYNMLIYNTDFDPDTELKAIEALKNMRVDAFIIASSGGNSDTLKRLSTHDMPVVQFQLEHDDSAKNIIVSDYRNATFKATEYLLGLGHKNICFVTQEYTNVKSRLERFLGFKDAMTAKGIKIQNQHIQFWDRDIGLHNSPQKLLALAEPPSVFFTQHLAITVDLMKALSQTNISVPDKVSLIGFDDIPMAEFFKVPITVIKQNPYAIGQHAAKLTIEKIQGKNLENTRVLVACELLVRQSCRHIV